MYIPLLSPPRKGALERRKGGGGHGGGGHGGGHGSSGHSSGHSGGSSSSGHGSSGEGHGSTSHGSSGSSSWGRSSNSGGKISSWPYGKSSPSTSWGSRGGGTPQTISSGQPFAGRMAGGATRDDIYGSRAYGSGYPGYTGRGVSGRSFPYWFWPVVWGGAAGAATGAYISHSDEEYGHPEEKTRPGGALYTSVFPSAQNSSQHSVFRILADNDTTTGLYNDISTNCSAYISSPWAPVPYNSTQNSSSPSWPVPEQVVQYYRASSIALSLDGYNNSATYAQDDNAPDSPLPDGYDGALLYCMNMTIGNSALLIGSGIQTGGVIGGSPTAWIALALVVGKIIGIL